MKYLYLDSSRLRELANNSVNITWAPVDSVIRFNEHMLVLSLVHLFDLSYGRLSNNNRIAAYLDSLKNIKWVPFPYDIFKKETHDAAYYLLEGKKESTSIFFDTFRNLVTYRKYYQLKKNIKITNVLMTLESMYDSLRRNAIRDIINRCIRNHIFDNFRRQLKSNTNKIFQINKNTEILTNTDNVLRRHIETYLPEKLKSGTLIPKNVTFLGRLIDLVDEFMPSLKFTTDLLLMNFRLKDTVVEENDFIDDFHASFAPYCDAILLAEGLCDRAKQINSGCASKIVSKPRELLDIIEK